MARALASTSIFFLLAGCAGAPPCPDGWVEASDGSCDASPATVAAVEARIGPTGAYGFVRVTSTSTLASSGLPNRTTVTYPPDREVLIYQTHSGGACQSEESLVARPITDETGTWAAALAPGLHCAVLADPGASTFQRIDFSVGEGLLETEGFDLTE